MNCQPLRIKHHERRSSCGELTDNIHSETVLKLMQENDRLKEQLQKLIKRNTTDDIQNTFRSRLEKVQKSRSIKKSNRDNGDFSPRSGKPTPRIDDKRSQITNGNVKGIKNQKYAEQQHQQKQNMVKYKSKVQNRAKLNNPTIKPVCSELQSKTLKTDQFQTLKTKRRAIYEADINQELHPQRTFINFVIAQRDQKPCKVKKLRNTVYVDQ